MAYRYIIQVEYHWKSSLLFYLASNNLEEWDLRRSKDSKRTIKKVATVLEKATT